MKFYAEIFGITGLLPALVSVLVVYCFQRSDDDSTTASASRYAGAMSFAIAFCVAWFSLPWLTWSVKSAWQWQPWLSLLTAAVISTVHRDASKRSLSVGWIASIAVIATVCAFLIVPDRVDMVPTRTAGITAVSVLAVGTVLASQHLTNRLSPTALSAMMMMIGFCSSVLMGLAGSMKFAQLAGAMTAATTGCLWISWRTSSKVAVQTLLPTFLILLSCLIYTGFNESFVEIPDVAFVLIATSMCWLNLSLIPPIQRLSDRMRTAVQFGVLSIPLLIGLAIAASKGL